MPSDTRPAIAKTSKKNKGRPAKFWVGIGASAGGLEALREFVHHLPVDASATYIVAQHVAPKHRSMLAEIIGRETPLPVKEVTDRLLPEANTIYITPPNANVLVKDGRLRLVAPSTKVAAPKPSVNDFFSSLAKAKGADAIGIIMSGTGSDGASGISEIHRAGGITLVQDYMTAKYSSMPVAAVDTGHVDLVMSTVEMASQFTNILSVPRNLDVFRASPVNMDSITELTQLLLEQTKVNFRHYKTPTFQRRVERRMAAVGASSLPDYVHIARKSPAEIEALFRDLLITVTSFFRDPKEFGALRRFVRNIIVEKGGQPIRVWVAGTATGEEAYSIAILFAQEMGGLSAFAEASIQIFASDLDNEAIEVARRGFYPETAFAEVPGDVLSQYFQAVPTGYKIAKEIREKIVFSIHNLAQDPPLLNLDMVSCRNLLIYFQPHLQSQVFARFHYGLRSHGVLFLGKSETTAAAEGQFTQAKNEEHIFIQRPSQSASVVPREIYQPPNIVPRAGPSLAAREQRALEEVKCQLNSLIESVGPNCLLVNSDMKVVRSFGDVSAYVGLAAGAVDMTTMSLLKEPFRQDLRSSVPNAIQKMTSHSGIVRKVDGDPTKRVRLRIYPLRSKPDAEAQALVVFEEWTEVDLEIPEGEAQNAFYENQIKSLTDELAVAQSTLMQMVEELETSNEELQTLNEELQSTNEELQSTNEELETANEELQSTNEELSTVNEEMQVNAQQVGALNQSLNSILENISIPLLVVDCSLNITNLSRTGETFFGISPDIALPHITRCKFPMGLPDIVKLLNQALISGDKIEATVDKEDINATLTVIPYFANQVDLVGAIVLVADNTNELKKTRNELQLIFDNLPASILVSNRDGKVLKANAASSVFMERSVAELEGATMAELYGPSQMTVVQSLDAKALLKREPVVENYVSYVSPSGVERFLNTCRIPHLGERKSDDLVYTMAIDVTDQYRATRDLEISEKRLEEAVTTAGVGHWEWDIETDAVFWSANLENLVGLKNGGFGGTFDDFKLRIHTDDVDRVEAQLARHLKSSLTFDFEFRMRHQKGHHIWVRAFGRNSFANDGAAISVSGTVQDITKTKHAELEIKQRSAQLQMASKLAALGYWKIIPQTDSLYFSEEMYAILGVDPKEIASNVRSFLDRIHPEDLPAFDLARKKAQETHKGFELDMRFLRPDGEVRFAKIQGETQVDQTSRLMQIFGTLHDVSEDRIREQELKNLLDELSRSNEELNRFSYVCSHDMKEPVRMIENMSQMLLDPQTQSDETQRDEILKRINTNMMRLRGIIDSLLAYSRVDAKVEVTSIDLGAVIDEVLETLTLPIVEQKTRVTRGKMPKIRGSRVHFVQLFQNLVGNALKHSDAEHPRIKISSVSRQGLLVLRVEDNGQGIPEESRKQIFELFGRLQRRDEAEGTGLGLSICKKIVAQYGGDIKCRSSKLGGAMFEISIPIPKES